MLKIRMQRLGKINQPTFRLIVVEHTESPKTGSFVEKVGTYNPRTKEKNFNDDRIKYWLSVGAKASGTVHNMFINAGLITGKKINVLPKKSPPKKDEPAAEAAPAAAEKPVEEVPAPELKDEDKPAVEAAVDAAKE